MNILKKVFLPHQKGIDPRKKEEIIEEKSVY